MEHVNWSSVLYDDDEKKLVIVDQNLDNIPLSVLNNYCDKIKYFDFSHNNLRTFVSLRFFSKLETIILDNNKLTNDSFTYLRIEGMPFRNVKTLSINNNKIEDIEELLNDLKNYFPKLEYLSLLGNPSCPDGLTSFNVKQLAYDAYQEKVVQTLPNIRFLNHCKVQKRFSGSIPLQTTKLLKYSPKVFIAKLRSKSNEAYTPLPENFRATGDHCGAYGCIRLKYIGNHSEGNRFICNNDL